MQQVWKSRLVNGKPGGSILEADIPTLELLVQKESGHAFAIHMSFAEWAEYKLQADAAILAFQRGLFEKTWN